MSRRPRSRIGASGRAPEMTLDDAVPAPAPLTRPGRTVSVTGGTGGIGLATATTSLAETGARLVLIGRDPARGEQARRAVGGDSTFLAADLDSLDEIRRVTRALLDVHGRPNVLIANAVANGAGHALSHAFRECDLDGLGPGWTSSSANSQVTGKMRTHHKW